MFMRRLGSFFLELTQIIVFSVSIFLVIYLLVMQPHKIKGASMEPNFHNNEYLLTDKVSYRFAEPKRGDVVVFKAPPDYRDEFIKRIIALPGENVMVSGGKIYVNGEPLNEQYIPSDFVVYPGKFAIEGKIITVTKGEYFVLGDNREHSLDSRNIGLIPRDKITGRAWMVYWPVTEAGAVRSPSY
jgi:signal peptidase I